MNLYQPQSSTEPDVAGPKPTRSPNGLRVVFAGGNGYPPEAQGGVQSSTHDLATRLFGVGASPAVLAPLYGDGLFGLAARTRLKFGRARTVTHRGAGYPVHRAWFPCDAVHDLCASIRPDVAVVQCHGTVPLAQEFRAAGVPTVIYLRNVEFEELGGDPSTLSGVSFIANSAFTAKVYRERFGIEAVVIPPTVERSRYATATTGEYVTFINPVPDKGLDKALAIARECSDIPFLFHESWLLDPPVIAALQDTIRPLANVRFERRSADMKSVYGKTRIVLAPSRWSEAWGRVASEAHCSGIPVIGSRRGGLPEAIGPGGIVLDYDAPDREWVDAVREVWSSEETWRRLSAAALAYAERPEMSGARQFEVFLSIVMSAAGAAAAA